MKWPIYELKNNFCYKYSIFYEMSIENIKSLTIDLKEWLSVSIGIR